MVNKNDSKINISGHGTLKADAVAVGYRANAQKIVNAASMKLADTALAEVRTKLETLMAALNRHADELADPKPLYELVERIAAELNQKQPHKLTLKGFLTTIAEETKSVGEIAAAALSLKELVVGL